MEIMSPVGSYESLQSAIQAGADSVYFGVNKLNMRRAAAKNFPLEDLPKIVKICEDNKIKSYLTLNTVIYNNDLELMKEGKAAKLKQGHAIFFASFIRHRVTPVIRGNRKSLVMWFGGTPFK